MVYKVDRLTRSLPDFAKIVEIFDAQAVSFVSVTQQFNTTTCMGRLTLNVLLSFAQFEREVTGERIRDKIAASKKKGMWMGGTAAARLRREGPQARRQRGRGRDRPPHLPPLSRARIGAAPEGELDREGSSASAVPPTASLRRKPLARGALYLMLQTASIAARSPTRGQSYPGEHGPIVDESLWDEVQAILAANRVDRDTGAGAERAKPARRPGL